MNGWLWSAVCRRTGDIIIVVVCRHLHMMSVEVFGCEVATILRPVGAPPLVISLTRRHRSACPSQRFTPFVSLSINIPSFLATFPALIRRFFFSQELFVLWREKVRSGGGHRGCTIRIDPLQSVPGLPVESVPTSCGSIYG